MSNLTTNQKKQILSQVVINNVNSNKCILKFVGANLNEFNYAEIVALMLVNRERLNKVIIDLLEPKNTFSKEVRAIQYS